MPTKAHLHDKLRGAFVWLEQAREMGKIRAYGVATWKCFRVALGAEDHVSLQDLVHLARDVGGLHHGFRWLRTLSSCICYPVLVLAIKLHKAH